MTHRMVTHLDKKDTDVRHVEYSRHNGMIPRLYVPEWKMDMKNRSVILENALYSRAPTHEHDEPLYREKREQMSYNVEARSTVDRRYLLPDRCRTLCPIFHHQDGRHFSSCMYYRDGPDPRWPANQRAFDMPAIMTITANCPK